jgi:hypothetical protein
MFIIIQVVIVKLLHVCTCISLRTLYIHCTCIYMYILNLYIENEVKYLIDCIVQIEVAQAC